MSTKLPGSNPTAYLGIKETNPPQLYFFNRAPLATDARPYDAGDVWIDRTNDKAYRLIKKVGPVATWVLSAVGTSDLDALTGDIGGVVGPDAAHNINILGGTDTSVTGTPGTNTLTINSTAASIDQQQIIYVGKHGNDANDGLTIDKAMLTFGAAITAAAIIAPAVVVCFDDGTYVENIATVANVNIDAENATLNGTLTGADDTFVELRSIVINAGTAVTKSAGAGRFTCAIETVTCTGAADAFLCTSGILNVKARILTVQNGFGLNSTSTQHVHIEIEFFIISGNGTCIDVGVGATVFGFVQHFLETGGPTGTGITNSGGNIDLHFNSISTDVCIDAAAGVTNLIGNIINPTTTAYDIAAGATLNLTVNELSGAETVAATGIVNIYQNDSGVKSNQTWNIINPETTNNLFAMTAAGTRTMPLQPTFNAAVSVDIVNVTGAGTSYLVLFDQENFDIGANYNPATGQFTVPTTGIYYLNAQVHLENLTAAMVTGAVRFYVDGTPVFLYSPGNPGLQRQLGALPNDLSFPLSTVISLTAAQVVDVRISVGSGVGDTAAVAGVGGLGDDQSWFSGYLLG